MKTLKPKEIKNVLDMAAKVTATGGIYVPCFAGDAGIGKSQVIQQWAREQGEDFVYIDLRMSYLESPDLIGLPEKVQINGEWISIHAMPDFLPREGRGILVFEEPNRAHESTMNAMMQILTDRKIHKYTLPPGFVLAAAINPEGRYTVNTMDPAMKSRFAMFNVEYDHNSFVEYTKASGWNQELTAFIDKFWTYKTVNEIAEDGFYVAPRNFHQVQALMKVDAQDTELFPEMLAASIGSVVGSDFLKFRAENRPVLLPEIMENQERALAKLKKITDSDTYSGDLISLTVNSVAEGFNKGLVSKDLLSKVVDVLTVDQGINLVMECASSLPDVEAFMKDHEKLIANLKRRQTGKVANG